MDVRKKIMRKGKNSGQLSDSQKTGSRMRQWAFPSYLCNLLSKTINGETNCVVIMCISPSPYNGSETAFTIEFGARLAHLPSQPMPSQIKEFDSLLSSVRKFLDDNPVKDSIPPEKMNRYQLTKLNLVQSKKKELEFLESLCDK